MNLDPTVTLGALNFDSWNRELPDSYPNRNWILEGIREGFYVLNVNAANRSLRSPVFMNNYKSATVDHARACEQQILEELNNGRYVISPTPPMLVSALGAIPKKNGKVRLIHDASRPDEFSLNGFCDKEYLRYQSIQDAVEMITPGAWLAKVDLSMAYRSVKTHPSNYPFTGLSWTFEGDTHPTFMCDTRLSFGARRSPFIFNTLTQAVREIMACNYDFPQIVAFLDDFLLIHPDKSACEQGVLKLIKLLRALGFAINYEKVEMPTQRITFLGVVLDSNKMCLELPEDKLKDIRGNLKDVLDRNRITKRQLQILAGKLAFAAQVIYGGNFFVRNIHNAIAKLRRPFHRTRVTSLLREDLKWWINFLHRFNGLVDMVDPRPVSPLFSDACDLAAGAVYAGEFVYLPWCYFPELAHLHINFKETLAVILALQHWSTRFKNKKVIVFCDNQAAVGILNRGSSREPVVMRYLQKLFWLTAELNFRVLAVYYPGVENKYADAVSRIHEMSEDKWSQLGVYPTVFQCLQDG